MRLTPQEDAELFLLDKEERRRNAQKSLIDFIQYHRVDYKVAQFHDVVGQFLDMARRREIRRLIINGPPQHGKSEIVSRNFPAHCFGNDPSERIIGASYAASLATEMCLDQQKVIDKPATKEVFPHLHLSGDSGRVKGYRRLSDLYDIVGYGGQFRASGVQGGITGRPCTIGIIDDPYKDHMEAWSPLRRENVWNWYIGSFLPRIADDGVIIITMTRWHEDDLVGRILKNDKEAKKWTVLNFEAIKESPDEKLPNNTASHFDTRKPGEALAPHRFTLDTLKDRRTILGPTMWNALYRGRPSSPGGDIIKREWCTHFYRKAELPLYLDMKVTSWDVRFKEDKKTGDYVHGTAWARKGAGFYLLGPKEVRARLSFTETVADVKLFSYLHRDAKQHLMENKANGPAVENVLKKDIPRLLLVEPQGGKEVRLRATEGLWKAGNVFLPHPEECPWVLEWIEEIVNFPRAENDDRVDTCSQALIFLENNGMDRFRRLLLE